MFIILVLIAFPDRIIESNIKDNISIEDINNTSIINNTSVAINDTTTPRLVIPKSSIDIWWENVWNFPKELSDERPWLGGIILVLLLTLVWHGYGRFSDWIRKKVGRK